MAFVFKGRIEKREDREEGGLGRGMVEKRDGREGGSRMLADYVAQSIALNTPYARASLDSGADCLGIL